MNNGSRPLKSIQAKAYAAKAAMAIGMIVAGMVMAALRDRSPAVRSFALLVLAHRGVPQEAAWLDDEEEPTVIRTALRCGYAIEPARLARGVGALGRSSRLDDKLLAAELALLSDDEALHEYASELVKLVILRMNDVDGGSLSPRLARITGGPDVRRAYKWRNWRKKNGRRPLSDARMLPSRPLPAPETIDRSVPTSSHGNDLSVVAELPLPEFIALARHLETLPELRQMGKGRITEPRTRVKQSQTLVLNCNPVLGPHPALMAHKIQPIIGLLFRVTELGNQ